MKYITWSEYFHSKEFYTLLMEDIESHAPKIEAEWIRPIPERPTTSL